jgi:hypothetical protein
MQKAMMPLAGISFGLILFQGASGWAQVGGADWGHAHTAHLLTLIAIAAAVVAVKGEFSAESKVKPHAFALAGFAVIQEGIGSGLMSMSWSFGWIHIVLALAMAGHAFALLMLTKMALATDSDSDANTDSDANINANS